MSTRQQIEQICMHFTEAHHKADAKAIAATFTEDATMLFAGAGPVQGRKAIEEYYAEFFAGGSADPLEVEITQIGQQGSLAFAVGTYSSSGETGTWLDVLNQQADGTWRFHVVSTGPNA